MAAVGAWTKEELDLHIILEMKAVQLALTTFRDQIMGEFMVLMSDNATVVACLKKHGGIVSWVVCNLMPEMLTWAEQFMIFLTAKYILGQKNPLTNQLSHQDWVLPTKWSFLPLVFESVCREYSRSLIKLSVTRANVNCPYMCLQFPFPWLGRRMPSSTVGVISLFMPSLRSLF